VFTFPICIVSAAGIPAAGDSKKYGLLIQLQLEQSIDFILVCLCGISPSYEP